MARSFDGKQRVRTGHQLQRRPHLFERSEGIARAVYEQRGCRELREMRGTEFSRALQRMQRVREQQQARRQVRLLRGQHGRLPAAVRMASQKDLARNLSAQHPHRSPQAGPIPCRRSRERRPMRPRLTIWQIAAQHRDPFRGERFR